MTPLANDFVSKFVDVGETTIHASVGGAGPAVLLLHGFPQTHLMWRKVAPLLARRSTVVCADLRGYGQSGCPPSTPDHLPYSKRTLARDMVTAMARLGFPTFSVVGHDRGGRVAYRLALDHPSAVQRLGVLDVVPIIEAWEHADARLAKAFWPWSLLSQPFPLPERLIAAAPEAVINDALGGWGSPSSSFEPEIRDAYVRVLRNPASVHAICEEFRAAASIDVAHDADDRDAGRRIACPVLALWSDTGPLGTWYAGEGGPVGIWRNWALDVRGHALAGGHFFPEELASETADALLSFLDA